MRISRHNLLALSLVGGSTILFVLIVIAPGDRKLSAAQAETRRIESAMMAAAARIVAVDSVAAEVTALRADTASFDRQIPSDPNLGVFLGELTSMLERNRMENHILQPRPAMPLQAGDAPRVDAARLGVLMEQPVLVQCEGACENWFAVLKELESAVRLTRMDRLKVTSEPERPGRVKVDASITVFYRAAARPTGGL